MPERRFKSQITDILTEQLPDTAGGALEQWLAPTTESKIEQIPVEQIRDRGWRAEVDVSEPAYRALKASIRASGVLQPLLLRPHPDGGFEVVSGARRLRAARETVQSTVPAVVRELNDVQALVGGSWDAVLREGLTAGEGRRLVAQLVAAGMGEAQADALVGTVPVREGDEDDEVTEVAVAEPDVVAEAVIVEEPAAVEPEVVEAEPQAEIAAEPEATAPPEPEAEIAAEPAVEEAVVPEPETEPAAEAVIEVEVEAEVEAALDVDDVAGWPAAEEATTATAPTTPPAPVPVDPVTFPVTPLSSENGIAPAAEESAASVEEAAEAPIAEEPAAASAEEAAEAPIAEEPALAPAEQAADAPVAEEPAAPEPEAAAPEPLAAEPEPEPEPEALEPEAPEPAVIFSTAATHPTPVATPHVIPIKLPEPATALADEEPAAADSMPVAAPAPGDIAAHTGTQLTSDPVPAVRFETPAPLTPTTLSSLLALLRRGPLFYAVGGIGLAVGAIVFIFMTVAEGAGSGAAPIIVAVILAILGFVTAMVCLGQPRQQR